MSSPVALGSKLIYNEEKNDSIFPGKSAEFALVEKKPYAAYDLIFFDSSTLDSFFSQVCINFGDKSIAVATDDSNLRNKFRSYFLSQGISGDSISLCLYTARTTPDLQRLSKILLNNNKFPEDWVLFFQSLLKDGTWTITSKKEISNL